jgi:hypothetical protein
VSSGLGGDADLMFDDDDDDDDLRRNLRMIFQKSLSSLELRACGQRATAANYRLFSREGGLDRLDTHYRPRG